MLERINAIVLAVKDVKRCAHFYSEKLGFHLDQLEDEEAYLTIGSGGGTVLALKSVGMVAREISEERIKPRAKALNRTTCVIFVADVDAEYDSLRKKGVRFIDAPTTSPFGWRTTHFEDPEENLWELSQKPKKQ